MSEESLQLMDIALAAPLVIEAIAAILLVKLKLEEKMPGTPLLSPEDHRKIREKAFIAIIPFPINTHHEQETAQQSKEMDSGRTSGE